MFKELVKGCMPIKATKYSAGIDVFSANDVTIGAGETVIVGLGISVDEDALRKTVFSTYFEDRYGNARLDKNGITDYSEQFLKSHYISLKPRSSLRAKGLISHSGVVDLDYKGELKMIIHNPVQLNRFVYNTDNVTVLADDYDTECEIKKGDKIGQLLLIEHKGCLFGVESEEERTGGLGSTGDK